MSLAAESARVHPARLPRASSRLARAKAAAKLACARSWARLIERGVGWRSICAPIDCGANGPAFGLPTDCRTARSNCAIWALQGPARADPMLRPKAKMKKAAAIRRPITVLSGRYSNAKMRFQSSFMLMIVQYCFFAMSYISWLKAPTDVLGKPCAGP